LISHEALDAFAYGRFGGSNAASDAGVGDPSVLLKKANDPLIALVEVGKGAVGV
jgi:hypothetical protein